MSENYSIPLIQIYQKTSNKSNRIVLLERYCWDLCFVDAQTGSMNSKKGDNENMCRTLQ